MFKKLIGKTLCGRALRLLLVSWLPFMGFEIFQAEVRVNIRPENYVVRLPEFKGRIFDHSQVHPGTFNIEEDFAFISQWGKDGIMTYRVEGNTTIFEAWRPDSQTANIFVHTKMVVLAPEGWNYYDAEVVREGDYLIISPVLNRHHSIFSWMTLAGIFSGVGFCVLILACRQVP